MTAPFDTECPIAASIAGGWYSHVDFQWLASKAAAEIHAGILKRRPDIELVACEGLRAHGETWPFWREEGRPPVEMWLDRIWFRCCWIGQQYFDIEIVENLIKLGSVRMAREICELSPNAAAVYFAKPKAPEGSLVYNDFATPPMRMSPFAYGPVFGSAGPVTVAAYVCRNTEDTCNLVHLDVVRGFDWRRHTDAALDEPESDFFGAPFGSPGRPNIFYKPSGGAPTVQSA